MKEIKTGEEEEEEQTRQDRLIDARSQPSQQQQHHRAQLLNLLHGFLLYKAHPVLSRTHFSLQTEPEAFFLVSGRLFPLYLSQIKYSSLSRTETAALVSVMHSKLNERMNAIINEEIRE